MSNSKSLISLESKDDNDRTETLKPVILEEDVYIDSMERIVQKNFFPDLPKWKDQCEYIEAKKKRDFAKMMEIRQKYAKNPPKGNFMPLETPNFSATPSKTPGKRKKNFDDDEQDEKPIVETDISLGQFLNKYTSEDNASYSDLTKKEWRDNKKRIWWTEHYDKYNRYQLDSSRQSAGNLTWPVNINNSLMYVPDSINKNNVYTEKILVKENTKISPDILIKDLPKKKEIKTVVSTSLTSPANVLLGLKKEQSNKKIDLDDLVPPPLDLSTSKVGGYSYLSTPDIDPNQGNESPFMTWGEIQGTPLLLDIGSTPIHRSDGPQFKISDETPKEKKLKELTQKKKKKDSPWSSSQKTGSQSPRIGNNTPIRSVEGRRLASRMLKKKYGNSIDHQLRASYNSPIISSTNVTRTPMITPKSTPILTPKSK